MSTSIMCSFNKLTVLGTFLLCSLVLSACSNDSDVEHDDVSQKSQTDVNQVRPANAAVQPSDAQNGSPLSQLNTDDSLTTQADNKSSDDESMDALSNNEDELDTSDYDAPDYTSSNKVVINQEATSGVIRWQAPDQVDYTNAVVTISDANGDRTSRTFGSGEPIELYGTLPDGLYSWETVITPELSEYTKERMRDVRQSGDFQAEKELIAQLRSDGSLPTQQQANENRQSGNFIVQNGVVRPSNVDGPVSDEDSRE